MMPTAAAFAVLVLLITIVVMLATTYNAVVALGQRIDKAWANIDVILKQRHDELPRLVDAVRGLMGFERDVLEEVTRLRADYRRDAPVDEQAAVALATTIGVQHLLAVVEAYPDIKSHGNVLAVQDEIRRMEDMLADRRELYNDMVYRFNTRIRTVPAVLIAGLFGWQPRPFFQAEAADRERPAATLT
ncbi:MAG TPA: LemA family protein [Candidatus Limnocylindrales bacterium]